MSRSAAANCYYGDPEVCDGKTWTCMTCGQDFCEAHGHRTELGFNVECVACEAERMEELAGR